MAVSALLLYEIFITSGQEIRYLWMTSWTKITVLHVLIRYYALGYLLINTYVSINANLSVEVIFCTPFNTFQVWGALVFVPFVDLLIILRIYALYHGSKKMAVFLGALYIAEVVATITFIAVQFQLTNVAMGPDPLPPGILPDCFTQTPSADLESKVVESGALVTAFQAIYFALTMYKLIKQVKSPGLSLNPLLKVFFRDGAGYCLIIFIIYLFVTVLFAVGAPNLQGIAELWLISIVAITAGRLVLNIREVAAAESDCDTESSDFQVDGDHGGPAHDPQQLSSVIEADLHINLSLSSTGSV
ncbi:hypothetical protein JB92DRAFT_2971026 [Gautieria morchelliformis]|nr:hypothetical protein JB92DRAFT_2971026 [Gautieria morchelliformis]